MIGSALSHIIERIAGQERASVLFSALEIDPVCYVSGPDARVPRATIAQALAMLLFDGLLTRVPSGRAYVNDAIQRGTAVHLDHGALRTVAGATGALPSGRAAFARFLEPLGYAIHATYPLDRIHMTGYAYAHTDCAETIAQYFVSELHPERLSPPAQAAVARTLASSRDPLDARSASVLAVLAREKTLPFDEASVLVGALIACFDRMHAEPALADYETLLAESPEMAWIATEGNAFNHATDRVLDIEALARDQRERGRSIKNEIETSRSGRIRQTAFVADTVTRGFLKENGSRIERAVPGSFFEFIARDRLDDGRLDLAFDAANAQAIFKMTARQR